MPIAATTTAGWRKVTRCAATLGLASALLAVVFTPSAARAFEDQSGAVPAAAEVAESFIQLSDPQPGDPGTTAADVAGAINDSPRGGEGFIYLKSQGGKFDPASSAAQVGYGAAASGVYGLGASAPSLLRPDVTSSGMDRTAGDPFSSQTLQIGTFTPRYAGFRLGFGLGATGLDPDAPRKLDVSLTSTYFAAGVGASDPLLLNVAPAQDERRAYNVGLNVGIFGLTLGASYLKGSRIADLDYEGYDLGLSYAGRAWATSLQFSAVTHRRNELLSPGNAFSSAGDADKVQSVQFGASYTFGAGITLAGRFQYYDFRSSFLREDANDAQVFFLGTNLNF